MSLPVRFLCLCLVALFLQAALASEPEPQKIDSYKIDLTAPGEVSDLLKSYLDVYKWRSQKGLSVDELQAAVDRTPQDATSLLNTEGYFKPDIQARMQPEGDSYHVFVTVDPGPEIEVRKVDLRLTGPVNDDATYRDALLARLARKPPLATGDIFTQSDWDLYKRTMLNGLLVRRYAGARISQSEALVSEDKLHVDLTLVIDSGPAYHYGPVKISGMQRYPEKIVRDQVHLTEGDEYRRYEILNLQTDLQEMPQIGTAVVDAQLDNTPPYNAPIDIAVQEAPLQKLGLAAGYSTNTRYRGQVDYRYNNIADRGWVWNTKAVYEGLEQSLTTDLSFPKQPDGYSHKIYFTGDHSVVQGLSTTSYKGGVSRTVSDRNIDRTLTLEYLVERRDSGDGNIDHPHSLTLNYQWIRRDLDNQRDPHKGTIWQVEGGGASGDILSTQTFVRLYSKGALYWPVGEEGIFLGRLEAGQTFARTAAEVPTDWLFRAGGAGSVRGYDYQSLGVKADDGTVNPGRVLATSSVEYQHPVYKAWRGAVFADYGDAADTWQTWQGHTGVGVGARWISPVGSIGADIAYGLTESQWRFHFAMGLAF
ncbi:translocation and assembly module TamA [Silvimonas terrae]|uniref:Translocation and assembly module TamA n=1 Tax=Silvimonas terrae TaxID=300266 RepID=A0A840RKD4_9NEIS|nr:BamA/TamA family outer membrane protein [Silvimonas terrae]MBB5193607.1 translocation and assembly module TamA [Silvimonas terrae]